MASAVAAVSISAVGLGAEPATTDTATPTAGAPAGGASGMAQPAGMYDPYRSYQSDYPAADVQAVVMTRAEAARSRVMLELTREKLYRFIDRSWDDFYNSKEYLDAEAAESRAHAAYERERDRVLKNLNSDPNYRALTQLVKDMHEKIDRDKPQGAKASPEEVDHLVAVASVKMGYSSTASAMEAAALSADSGVQDARNRLIDAGNRKAELRRSQDHNLRRSTEFADARDALDQARLNRTVAEAVNSGAVEARDIALNYAAFIHGWDQYRYSTSTAFGYGYGGVYSYPAYNSPVGVQGIYGGGYTRRY